MTDQLRTTIGELAEALEKRAIPHHLCVNPDGAGVFIATPGCARILALGASIERPSILWWDRAILQDGADKRLAGAIGGERLWFAPEHRYHWQGDPDWTGFSNYAPSPLADPGDYKFSPLSSGGGRFTGDIELLDHVTGRVVRASVEKSVHFVDTDDSGEASYGIAVDIALDVDPGDGSAVDLWSIVQVPAGTRLEVPLASRSAPLGYSPTGNWSVAEDRLDWRFTGTEAAKLGLGTGQVTGIAMVHYEAANAPCRTLVAEFPSLPDRTYCDHPAGVVRNDQVFQAWDGFGFGEIEFHSPAALARAGENQVATRYVVKCLL